VLSSSCSGGPPARIHQIICASLFHPPSCPLTYPASLRSRPTARPQRDPKQLARPMGPGEPETPQGSEVVWTQQAFGCFAFTLESIRPGWEQLGAGAPRGCLRGSYHPSGIRGSDSRLLPIKIAAAIGWIGVGLGWLMARCACAGAVVRQWRASRAAACRRSARARSGLLAPVPGARRRPAPPSLSAGRWERRSFPPRHLGCGA
jgi:hypothetical protein